MKESVYVEPKTRARLIHLKKIFGHKTIDETVNYLVDYYGSTPMLEKRRPKGGNESGRS